LAGYTACPPEQEQLLSLGSDDPEHVAHYREAILAKRVSLIDLLETFSSCALPFNIFLELLTPLRPRYYSISSSPLVDPARCTATVAVVEGPARSGHGVYHGACSSYLAERESGMPAAAFLQAPSTPFRLPADPQTPLIMVGPGAGVAPFRGFLEERAALAARGEESGEAMLFFGCRDPRQDFIYEDELRQWAADGIVTLDVAFSRASDRPKAYVQDEIIRQADEVWRLLEAGAVIYVCGDASRMAPMCAAPSPPSTAPAPEPVMPPPSPGSPSWPPMAAISPMSGRRERGERLLAGISREGAQGAQGAQESQDVAA
jgi:cytochrome P450/NADPH-cytochrome P450 reductase